MKGMVLKNQNGYFTIVSDNQELALCRSRGTLKRKKDILVGDYVEYDNNLGTSVIITNIYPRRNFLLRPPIANIDQLVLMTAIKEPELNLLLLDKMIIAAERANMRPLICINKCELNETLANKTKKLYQDIGYDAVCISLYQKEGLEKILNLLKGPTIAFSGPSGVGKSSLLNYFLGKEHFVSGKVSSHTGRGKNTTRHAELVSFCNGMYLMDTPGYSLLDISFEKQERIDILFPEFQQFLHQCKFHDCYHLSEPGCMIQHALESGLISKTRYASYVSMMMTKNNKKNIL